MLQALDYHLLAPSSASFLQRYLTAGKAPTEDARDIITHLAQVIGACANPQCMCDIVGLHSHIDHNGPDQQHAFIFQYLCELALVHSDPFLKYLPSQVAASSVCLARHCLKQPAWVSVHIASSKYGHVPPALPSPPASRAVLGTQSVTLDSVFRTCIVCLPWLHSTHSKQSDSSIALKSKCHLPNSVQEVLPFLCLQVHESCYHWSPRNSACVEDQFSFPPHPNVLFKMFCHVLSAALEAALLSVEYFSDWICYFTVHFLTLFVLENMS